MKPDTCAKCGCDCDGEHRAYTDDGLFYCPDCVKVYPAKNILELEKERDALAAELDDAQATTHVYREENAKLRSQLPRWIPVSERLPDANYGQYFVLTQQVDRSEPFASINFYNRGAWVECDGFEVVAWMPIPEVVK